MRPKCDFLQEQSTLLLSLGHQTSVNGIIFVLSLAALERPDRQIAASVDCSYRCRLRIYPKVENRRN